MKYKNMNLQIDYFHIPRHSLSGMLMCLGGEEETGPTRDLTPKEMTCTIMISAALSLVPMLVPSSSHRPILPQATAVCPSDD